ncbi:hypothetical protein QZM64_28015, partial [Burkholderia cepacia]|nr:hypothetical protein [Burkholderia cepacia]
ARLHVAVLLGSLFGRLVLETRFSRIPLANRRLQPSTTPGTLPIPALKTSIATLEKQISTTTSDVTGGRGSLSQKAAGYARLQLDSEFADKQLASAMTGLENARAEAQRKQLYLERLVQPNTPDVAIEPKRLKSVFETFALGMMVWGVLSLLLSGVREHHD